MQRRTVLKIASAGACGLAPGWALAQSDKPISMVLGYSAGGTTDFVGRLVATEMSKVLGRQIVVDNVPGASGMMAAQKVSHGPTDGSVIYLGGTDTIVIPMVNDKTKVDWRRDFQLIGSSSFVSMVFAVSAKSPYQSMSELLAALRKGKKDFNYATPGIGTMQHLFGALINEKGKVAMLHVPYKGAAQINTDLVGQHVDSAILTTTSALPFIKDGSMRALAIADSTRSSMLPNVKTIGEEEGFSSLSLPLWQAFFVKAGTPPAIVAAYEKALMTTMANPEVQKKMRDSGATPWATNGRDMTAYVAQQVPVYKEAIDAAKIVAE
ncbi:hypothetical protein RD110_00240 [Rhodoferax koreense]|uniref:ABC transporter substrate-binding protein n=1 Tax=Rhodoferax koreensis TaxID=1842727 RepID=A0A1P8JQ26_9BURK|nr:tripartite tricarboxylate transporter substrate binding protein [Rhodoferax koreense]APW35835.1 hypothetical protein RD110_00240 [Rhodoferax koreense]